VHAREIRLLSFNLNILPKGSSLMNSVGHRFKNARFAEFVPTLVEGAYDVLALQEVFSSPFFPVGCFQQQLLRVAQRCGYTYVARSPPPSWRDLLGAKKWTDSGLLILSRLPFLDQGYHTFRHCGADTDSNASKGVVYAKIQAGDSSLLLFNCHLQATHTSHTRASFSPAHEGYSSIRQAQLRELCQFVHETCHKHHNDSSWMLTGDFNIDAIAEPAVVDVLGPLYDDHHEETEEYLNLMGELNRLPFPSNVRDILKESYGGHPPTRPPREEFPRKIAGIFRHKVLHCEQRCRVEEKGELGGREREREEEYKNRRV
jgi:endonuclease/exonuclease/phosphatase family metal-dependent hydrolase